MVATFNLGAGTVTARDTVAQTRKRAESGEMCEISQIIMYNYQELYS